MCGAMDGGFRSRCGTKTLSGINPCKNALTRPDRGPRKVRSRPELSYKKKYLTASQKASFLT